MKIKWIIGTLGILLVASLAGNAWLGATLRAYRYNVSHGWFAYSYEGAPVYPIVGLPSADLKQMLDQIVATDGQRPEDKYILFLEVLSANKVDITTGRQDAPLSGGGKIFRFNKTSEGWVLDEKRDSIWVS
jgi:hypothetical protein